MYDQSSTSLNLLLIVSPGLPRRGLLHNTVLYTVLLISLLVKWCLLVPSDLSEEGSLGPFGWVISLFRGLLVSSSGSTLYCENILYLCSNSGRILPSRANITSTLVTTYLRVSLTAIDIETHVSGGLSDCSRKGRMENDDRPGGAVAANESII